MKLNKVVNFFKSKSVVDVVYLVMMILIVTMIKDMIVSMYKKRKDKQWLNQAFGKTKGGKNVEGFTGTGWTTASCSTIDDISPDSPSVCDRLKFLLCDENINKLRRLLNGITLSSTNGFKINTNGGDIDLRDVTGPTVDENSGGNIFTMRMYANDFISTNVINNRGPVGPNSANNVTINGGDGKIRIKNLEVGEIRPFNWDIGQRNKEDYVTIRAETYFKPGPTNIISKNEKNDLTYFRIYANDYYNNTGNGSRKGIQIQQKSANGNWGFVAKTSGGSRGDDYADW